MRLSKLIGKIYEAYGSVSDFSNATGISYANLTKILSGKNDLKKSTVIRIADALSISAEDIGIYFFPECVVSSKTE